ncbi:peptidoglycan hydrolase CwlO-like protein/3D (Asp-Asp-Asp) domain-containing protein [Clostridium moniliforme]|uniref:Peptidoglycan hydrolase CwlO-like protein/3D (Asp-Asp-Asp) domain-containing protein n=1 Tax=Clostridium moniliforme TaxID=39489 RepID=A0ABS4EZX5_9CLOT|nr:3D domain-containing protein [Clostridium moniliforme]MBP1889553.1 peptidoglycan hydrolase CwlO-like protein/3D (Asp-Asp-Asp) domain-containing protein [Clostridium moniliforme]
MKKILICFFVFLGLLLNISFPAFADTKDDIQKSKVQFDEISNKIQDLDNKISALDSQINSLNSSIQNNKDKMNSIEKEIDNTKLKIESTKKQVNEGQAILANRLRSAYKSGTYSLSSYIAFVFEAKGLGEFIGRIEAIGKIINADNDMIKELKHNVSSLQTDIKSLNTKKEDIVKLNDENDKNLKTLVSKQNDLKESKSKFDSEKSQIESVIIENEKKLIAHPIKVIDSSSSISSLQEAVSTLKQLLPQISNSSVKDIANSYISKGNDLISKKQSEEKNNSNKNNNSNSNNNQGNVSGKKTLTMEATAYAGHTITAMGTKPVRDPNGLSTVAVDKNVIPLGSKVYVSGYGYAIASDTGGDIVGNRIDLFMNSEQDCLAFGRRTVTVKIIAYPDEW